MGDLKSELATTEYNEMLAIIAGKPDRISGNYKPVITYQQYLSWAKRLKAAFDITYWFVPGTDEPAIKAVFLEIPTQMDFQKLVGPLNNRAYQAQKVRTLSGLAEFWRPAFCAPSTKPETFFPAAPK